jgi:uncharacterized protein YciI
MSQLRSSRKLKYSEIVKIVRDSNDERDASRDAVSDLYAQTVALIIGPRNDNSQTNSTIIETDDESE